MNNAIKLMWLMSIIWLFCGTYLLLPNVPILLGVFMLIVANNWANTAIKLMGANKK